MTFTLSAQTLQRAAFPDRLQAARAAGFDTVGLTIAQYRQALADGLTDLDLVTMLTEAGLTVGEVEGPWDWITADQGSVADTETIQHMASLFEVSHVTAVQFVAADTATARQALGRLADRLAPARVALEFMPFSQVSSLSLAWELVESLEASGVGLLLDAWHLARTHGWRPTLGDIAPERIIAVQLCDARPAPEPDLRQEARHRRLLPGPWSVEVLRTLRAHGFHGRIAVEVWSDELEALPPGKAAELAYTALADTVREAQA